MAKLSFAAAVSGWAEKVPDALQAVRDESTKEIVREMQTPDFEGGRLPFDTGFLWASLMASTAAMPRINPAAMPVKDHKYVFDFDAVEAVIINASVHDTIFLGYTAGYAAHQEYGGNGRPAAGFVRLAAMNWQQIVNRNAEKVRKAFGL
jgi:hypothetical protein